MTNDLRKHIAAVLSRVFEIEISAEDHPHRDRMEQWDSIKHLELILQLEEEFDIRFTLEQAANLCDMESIAALIEERS